MTKLKLLVVFMASCMLLVGCSEFNPFAPPNNQQIETGTPVNTMVEDEYKAYMEDVDGMLRENEEATEKNADQYSDKFKERSDSVYYNAIEQYTKPSSNEKGEGSVTQSFLRGFYSTYNKIRLASPIIFIASISFGVVGMLFTRYNKGARRFFLVAFVITIPLLLLVIVFGIGVLNSMFLY